MSAVNPTMALILAMAFSGVCFTLVEPRWGYRLSAWLFTWSEATELRRARYREELAKIEEQA